MKFDHKKLKGRMLEMNETYDSLSKKIGITSSTLCLKINGSNDFKVSEIDKICEVLEIQCEEIAIYFFAKEFEKTQIN